jgi:hypothetical protein
MSTSMAAPTYLPTRRPTAGMGWRVAVSIATLFGLVSFVLLYFAFWSGRFSTLQSVVVVIVAILVFVATNGAAWAGWGMRSSAVNPDEPR